MKQSPEGLNYGTTHKYDETPVNENYKESGKIEMGMKSLPNYDIMKGAEMLRHGSTCGLGSIDPCYGNMGKNK